MDSISSFIFLAAWIRKVEDDFIVSKNKQITRNDVEKSLKYYKKFETTFGPAFVYFFTGCQILWIFVSFSALSMLLVYRNFSFLGYSFFSCLGLSLCILMNASLIAFAAENLHIHLQDYAKVLDGLGDNVDEKEMRKLHNLKDEIRATAPINAMGFFYVNKGVLVNMLSFGLTYVVILLQFKLS